jgi:leucyl-tRNA synthetase
VQEYIEAKTGQSANAKKIDKVAHGVVKKVTSDIEDEKFNTAVAAMMEAVNEFYKLKDADGGIKKNDSWQFAVEGLLQVLAPFAPHMTEELWYNLGHEDTIHVDHWPKWDDSQIQSDTITIIVQVNGKLRAKLELSVDADEETVKKTALDDENVRRFIDSEPKKVIYVAGKLVSVVV